MPEQACLTDRQKPHMRTTRRRPCQRRRRPVLAAGFPLSLLTATCVVAPTLGLLSDVAWAQESNSNLNLTEAQVDIVVQRLRVGATQSWELGTEQQALIELDTPTFSVLNSSSLPPPSSSSPSSPPPSSLTPVFQLISTIVQNKSRTVSNESLSAPQPFFPTDGSAADPASNGVAALIANWTGQGNSTVNFGQAAEEQMAFLWSSAVPKTEDGAFSHRVSQVQLWSDFVYMVPPFLAYYGVLTSNRSMVESAHTQISLYRDYLRDSRTHNLWRHVVMGSDFQDEGYWSTGNGWAAAGMLRVLGTIQNSQYRNAMKGEIRDLRRWVDEIHDGMYLYMRDDGMFHNYANDNTTFVDAASAALLASTVYRHALLTSTYHHLPNAEFVRRQLWSPSSNSSNSSTTPSSSSSYVNSSSLTNMTHFTSSGWLTPVVNPHSFGEEGSQSPEGQAFVVMMYAAWRDWVQNGAVGANAGMRVRGEVPGGLGVGVVSSVLGIFIGLVGI